MYPIQMHEGDRGVGMGYAQFVDTFASVCREHKQDGRARAFGFLFYDMEHEVIRGALKGADGFQRLNERSGTDVTLFYLHDSAVGTYWRDFNLTFMAALGVDEGQAKTPCMVFFRVSDDTIGDVSIYPIDERSTDVDLTIAELENYVALAIKAMDVEGDFFALTSIGDVVLRIGGVVELGEFLWKLQEAAKML